MNAGLPRVLAFPDAMADARLFAPQASGVPGFAVTPWIAPIRDESLALYAHRLARVMALDPHEPAPVLVAAGVAAPIALELASKLTPRGVVLVNGVADRAALPRDLVHVARAPRLMARLARSRWAAAASRDDALAPPLRELVGAMASDVDASFLAWLVGAVEEWSGAPSCPAPVREIRGARGVPGLAQAALCEVVQGGGRFITLTHPERVNACIARARGSDSSAGGLPSTRPPGHARA